MKVSVVAVGRMKTGPERDLFERYLDRAADAGRRLGLTFHLREYPESPDRDAATRKDREAAAILANLPAKGALAALDERGRGEDSRAFAQRLGRWRDGGREEATFVIGGPDGLGAAILDKAELRLAFGPMTWPHQLVRLMLAEQLYRAVTILSGHPYHRE